MDRPKSYYGQLDGYFETGTEGTYWVLLSDAKYDHLLYKEIVFLEPGDRLEIHGHSGELIWEGVIDHDTKTGYQPYPLNPQYGQQCALGLWVHWIQQGFEPDVWARFFYPEDRVPLYGRIFKKALE